MNTKEDLRLIKEAIYSEPRREPLIWDFLALLGLLVILAELLVSQMSIL